ncbi:unnamed protein product [Chondrus crispus]|uniref:Right handed beta helix domain-containing protein n=1 Tax=Chondrus crispus TaxID=2769 RepID=R7QK15_CHOCR|nr:unnamed protein product [Chondrus crispus]CDF38078.1 unnamed protein product [Chondrus crispus]|eukprot:XP_005717947.1 unnamed protein product [Chondrus crispus]
MGFSLSCVVFLGLTLSQLVSLSQGQTWGAETVSDSLRPRTAWESKFPGMTVTVTAGQSVQSAISSCNGIVGSSGYCTVDIQGDPSDSSITISRSRTKLTSSTGAVITSSGAVTFIGIYSGKKQVIIEKLSLRGHTASEVYGIFLSGGNINKVIIRENTIYDFDGTDNAHGIAVYGSGSTPIRNVLIEKNEVYSMRTGSSESIVVNGNVYRWAINDNYVHDVNNIAIDAIGGEGTLPPSAGASGPHPDDAARGGFIEYNVVRRMSTATNSAYGNEESWAAGIYVDGARDIKIQLNEVYDAPWGYEVGAENCIITEDITVVDNFAEGSFYGDFLAGGYAAGGFETGAYQCNPLSTQDADEGHGNVERITVQNNEFTTTGGTEDNVYVQKRTTLSIIAIDEPGFSAVNPTGTGCTSPCDANSYRTS